MICFLGNTYVAKAMSSAALRKRLFVCDYPRFASLVFVCYEPPTDKKGRRDIEPIRRAVELLRWITAPIVVTSQVPPGFMRSLGIKRIWHQAELLRKKDAVDRATHPEQFIVGGPTRLPFAYQRYLDAFKCPVLKMSWESAEFAKVAINTFLAAQVDHTNKLYKASKRCGADWNAVRKALQLDSRIGPKAYLRPGRWQKSLHLLRDHVTLESI